MDIRLRTPSPLSVNKYTAPNFLQVSLKAKNPEQVLVSPLHSIAGFVAMHSFVRLQSSRWAGCAQPTRGSAPGAHKQRGTRPQSLLLARRAGKQVHLGLRWSLRAERLESHPRGELAAPLPCGRARTSHHTDPAPLGPRLPTQIQPHFSDHGRLHCF